MKSKDRVTFWGVRVVGQDEPWDEFFKDSKEAHECANRFNLQGQAIDAERSDEDPSERLEVVRLEITPV